MSQGVIDPRVCAALAWCESRGGGEVTLAIPFTASSEELHWLLSRAQVRSVIVPGRVDGRDAPDRVGELLPTDFSWRLPLRTARRLVYVGSRDKITARMIRAALFKGVRHMVFWDLDGWRSQSIVGMAGSRVFAKGLALLERGVSGIRTRIPASAPWLEGLAGDRLRTLLDGGQRWLPTPLVPLRNRIVMACPTLVAGGAERQIVNTVLGLRRRGDLDVRVLVSNLFSPPGNDFFLGELMARGGGVSEVEGPLSTRESWERHASRPEERVSPKLRGLLRSLPPDTGQEVANLYMTFRELRPSVVHAWLDHSSICAGLAAVMAGVPKVILSGRNVSPVHFPYILKPVMRPAYRALAGRPEVVFLNNSRGGAADYAAWLGLGVDRFKILYNGLDHEAMRRASADRVLEFRRAFDIPEGAPLVGGMFRLSAEKRPGLWLEAAARVLSERVDAYALLFGNGPMRSELAARMARVAGGDRIRLAPPTPETALALSAFDVLLLASRWEGTPNVVIEAQAVGTPVVVCGGGGAREALLDGVTGLFIEEPSAEALASALRSLLDDGELRQRCSQAGPGFVAERFGMDRMISETLELYGL